MSDPSLALQDAIEAALRADTGLKAAMGLQIARIYPMSAPNGAPYPYVIIGGDQVIDDSTECADSSEVITTVTPFARDDEDVNQSRRQAKAMAAEIRRIVKSVAVPGFDVVLAEFETTNHRTGTDGLTAFSPVNHRFLLDPA